MHCICSSYASHSLWPHSKLQSSALIDETVILNLQADNTSLPPQKKRRDKRAQILEAGGKLVIDQGFSAVTMVEIAEPVESALKPA